LPPTTSILTDSENFVANYFDVVHDKVLVLVGIVIPPNVQRDEFSLLGEKVLDALVAQALLFVHCWLCSSSSSVIVVRYRPPVPALSRTLGKRLRTTSTVADFRIFSSRAHSYYSC